MLWILPRCERMMSDSSLRASSTDLATTPNAALSTSTNSSPQKYIIPHLQPPSESDLEAAQKALEAKYDEASEMLKSLQVSTDSIAASLDEQKATVEKDLVIVRKAVEEMRAGEAKREEEARKIKEQVDEIVSSLPNVRSLPSPFSFQANPARYRC